MDRSQTRQAASVNHHGFGTPSHVETAGDGAPWTVTGMIPVRSICDYPYKGRASSTDRLSHSAAQNWACSVEPCSAVVSEVGLTAALMRSKYPVPTSRWCLTAV